VVELAFADAVVGRGQLARVEGKAHHVVKDASLL
jgi:hypothetical protein